MKKIFGILLLVTTLITSAFANDSEIAAGIEDAIYNTKNIDFKAVNFGIMVQNVTTGKTIYKFNQNHLFTPASVQKLFTATAALAYLKPSYRFVTSIYTTGVIHNNTLTGNIYIKFVGDPFFKRKDLRRMIDEMHAKGIHKIKGHVYIDNSDYDNVPYPPGWIWDDLSYSYAAPVNAIILNRNKFLLHFTPSNKALGAPTLSTKLPPSILNFHNHVETTSTFQKKCPLRIYSDDLNNYILKGCLYGKWGEQRRSLAVRDVVSYAKFLTKEYLNDNAITFKGSITLKQAPQHRHTFVSHQSPPLSKIIKEMLKKSDNLTTDAIFKKIGQEYYHTQGTWQNSLDAVKKILAIPTGINFKKNRLNDGAGLSRYNLIRPAQFIKLLSYIHHNPTVRPALYDALPIAGKDGTLDERMLNLGSGERIHAKTGSMAGVTTLTGFVRTKNHGMLTFVIMVNDFLGKDHRFLRLQNRVCEYLAHV